MNLIINGFRKVIFLIAINLPDPEYKIRQETDHYQKNKHKNNSTS